MGVVWAECMESCMLRQRYLFFSFFYTQSVRALVLRTSVCLCVYNCVCPTETEVIDIVLSVSTQTMFFISMMPAIYSKNFKLFFDIFFFINSSRKVSSQFLFLCIKFRQRLQFNLSIFVIEIMHMTGLYKLINLN